MNFIHQITKTDLDLAKQILPYADKYIKDYNHIPIIKPEEKEPPLPNYQTLCNAPENGIAQ
ncbi:MAG TPA: hypothetical protein VN721_13015 [Flavipsychrobacter sp.]|nr:hypothetical protein [Flavipsychrobacter sp.]